MSSGAALSTPREHLIKITSALTATGRMAAQAQVGIVDAGMAYPLGSLLTRGTGEQCGGPVEDGGSNKELQPDEEQGRKMNVLSVWYTAQC